MSNTISLIPVLKQRFFDNNGVPLAGGQLFSYQAGTSTPLATYTDNGGLTPNTNPVILDSAGYANVWMGPGAYKFVLEDSTGTVIFTVDNVVEPGAPVTISLTSQVTGILPVANGGTNSGTTLNNNRIMVSTGNAIVERAAQTPSAPLRTDVNGLPTTGSTSLTTEVSGTLPIGNGGTGQITQQAAINALAGTQSSGKYLRSDGTNTTLSTIQAGDVPTLNQNTTGTAANITATTNATLTTLSALSLPLTQSTGTLPIAKGGTNNGSLSVALGTVYYGDGTKLLGLAPGTTGQALKSNGSAAPSWGTVAGSGTKNYLSSYNGNPGNGDFELGSTTGFSLGTTGTLTNGLPTGSPTFGSGASGNLSLTTISSGQLAALFSMGYVSSAATTAGNMVASSAFTIDIEDQAKVLNWSVAYKAVTNPSNANWSGTSSNSFACAIWDVTNSAWIIPSGNFNFIQSSGVGQAQGSFQTTSNSTQYRIVVYNANATTGGVTLYVDDFVVTPASTSSSSSVVSWNGSQSSQAVTANVTDIAFTTIKDSSAAWNGTQYVVQIAGDYLVSGSLLPNSGSTPQVYRNGSIYNGSFFSTGSATNASAGATLVTGCKPGDTISLRMLNSTTVTGGLLGIFLIASQPGAGAGGVVAARAHVSSGVSTTALNPVNYDTIDFDTSGAITTGATTWQFKCPVSGYYHVEANGFFGAQGNLLAIYKNAVIDSTISPANVSNVSGIFGAAIVKCNAGDLLDVRPTSTGTPTVIASSPVTIANCNYVSIFLIQGTPGSANSGAVVALSVNTLSSTTVTAGTALKWTTTAVDTTASYSAATGGFTCPVSGNFQFEMGGSFGSGAATGVDLRKNGSIVLTNFGAINSGAITGHAAIWPGNAGDVFTVVPSGSLTTGSTTGFLSISLVK